MSHELSFDIVKASSESEVADVVVKERFISYVETLLEEPERLIGKGSLAEVHGLEANEKVCVKVMSDDRNYGTISQERVGSPFYNSAYIEAEFLSDLQEIARDVGVPKPYYSMEKIGSDSSGMPKKVSALIMERLPAVSLEHVINGFEEIPASYEEDSFWEKLESFVQKMHEKGIYHRDLHAGNIMIGTADGKPYVIDFGTAVYATEYDAYEKPSRAGRVNINAFIDDFQGLKKVHLLLKKAMIDKI